MHRKYLLFGLGIIISLFIVLYSLSECVKPSITSPNNITTDNGYPRLAMWWPNTSEQSVEQLERYDWIGFGSWDNIVTINTLKQRNPDQKHFMDYSITETSWSWWQDERKTIMEKIPAEWFLTQQGTVLTQNIDSIQIIVGVEAVTDNHGNLLFEVEDLIACEFETMKVTGINAADHSLTVERGIIRPAAAHSSDTRIAAHITFWPGSWVMNMSTLCPEVDVNDGYGLQNWIAFASRYWEIKNQEMWDGYIVDRIEDSQGWLTSRWCRNIDPDCSNQEVTDDYAAFDAAWNEGCAGFLQSLRSVFPGKALISNTSGAYHEVLNGAIYESFPGNWVNNIPETYQDWAGRALGENGYINVSKSGYSPNYSLTETYEDEEMPEDSLGYDNPFEHPDFVPNYQRMRYGLTTALLGDGYFSYEIGTNGHGSLGLMWFDEYDNGGRRRGYLGLPREEAVIIMTAGDGNVWKRLYEGGVVICNPTNTEVTVDLGGWYHLIYGQQVPEINTGERVRQVTIGPRDGRILIK